MTCDQDVQDGAPKRMYQYLAMITSSLGIISSGMHYGWTSASLPKLLDTNSHIPTTNDEGSWIAVALLGGAVCGALLAGLLLDRYGRKNVILLTSLPFIASWLMVACARTILVLVLARFLAGVGDGLVFCAVPMYLAEISDPGVRGLLGSSVMATMMLGCLLMNIIGSYMSITAAALVSAILPALTLVTLPWIPESPYYFLIKGNFDRARCSLTTFRGTDSVEQELKRIKEAVDEQNETAGKWSDLFTVSSNRKALFIVLGVRAVYQLSGSLAIMLYAQIIFKEAGDWLSPEVCSMIYFATSMVFAFVSSGIIDKVGRRPLMMFSTAGSCLALFVEGCYFYARNSTTVDVSNMAVVPVTALIAFVIMFNIGIQPMPLLLIAEMFPTDVKAISFSFNDMYYCLLSVIVSKFFQFTMDEFGIHVPFFTFAGCCALSLVFIYFFVLETNGKTLEEIQDELKGNTGKSAKMEVPMLILKSELVQTEKGEGKQVVQYNFA